MVLNTLIGKVDVTEDGNFRFVIESVVDGAGKELIGEEPRIVNVPVIYATEAAIVLEAGEPNKMLIFTKSDNVEEILSENRVSQNEKKEKGSIFKLR